MADPLLGVQGGAWETDRCRTNISATPDLICGQRRTTYICAALPERTMVRMEAHDWNERYRGAIHLWTERPNQLLVEEITGLKPGRALDLGAGEGRNALWLAEQGWQVTAVDFSRVAVERGAEATKRAGVDVEWVQADVTEYTPPAADFALVLILYLHLPPAASRGVLERGPTALRPGGRLLIVGHDLENLAGGPV